MVNHDVLNRLKYPFNSLVHAFVAYSIENKLNKIVKFMNNFAYFFGFLVYIWNTGVNQDGYSTARSTLKCWGNRNPTVDNSMAYISRFSDWCMNIIVWDNERVVGSGDGAG